MVGIGQFGRLAHAHMTRLSDDPGALVEALNEDAACGATFVAVIANRPVPAVVRRLDQHGVESPLSFVPIWPDRHWLQVGPVVLGGVPPCFQCYEARQRQHAPDLPLHDTISEHYLSQEPSEAAHVSRCLVRLAGAEALRVRDEVRDCSAVPGEVIRIGVGADGVLRGRVVPTHGCDHCHRDYDPHSRGWAELVQWAADRVING